MLQLDIVTLVHLTKLFVKTMVEWGEGAILQVAGQDKGWFHKMTMMDTATVARPAVEAMLFGKSSTVTGWMNKLSTFSGRLTPRRVATAVSAVAMKVD